MSKQFFQESLKVTLETLSKVNRNANKVAIVTGIILSVVELFGSKKA